ncbi:hypothetical protein N7481_012741 [Penicillium waksmanii]|uniref:uncharacterized protein n=1 Tax=Penicillium waksmanii TaxID=69791 RepID=UPI002549AB16|nr:uncharacterized protein N7481_012741 [Penicillium waksmanii]KAJ5966027.1 hypothetical protein N7481_012741 [Penicillium waksmanii]
MSGARHWEQDKEATVYIGNLDERASDSLVWELMLQAGRIVNVHLPKDRVTQSHQGYGFVEFISEEDAEYASRVMNGIRLFGKPIRVNKASADKQKSVEIGAELFVGNLDPMVSEQMLYDTFSRFGNLVNLPKVARDDNSLSKGYGFVSFADFESSDSAIANMNGQILMNKQVTVQYAYKKDGKGERHGDEAERMLATQARKHNIQQPTQQIVVPPPEHLQEFQMVTAHGPSALAPHRLLIWEWGEVCLRWDTKMFLLLRKCEPRRLVLLPLLLLLRHRVYRLDRRLLKWDTVVPRHTGLRGIMPRRSNHRQDLRLQGSFRQQVPPVRLLRYRLASSRLDMEMADEYELSWNFPTFSPFVTLDTLIGTDFVMGLPFRTCVKTL